MANPSGGDCPSTPPADAGSIPDTAQGGCTSASATPCSGLPAFTGTQVLDGSDDDFCNVPSFELNFSNAASNGGRVKVYNPGGTSYPESAIARVAWDSAGIHAFIHVTDPKFVPATDISWTALAALRSRCSSYGVRGILAKLPSRRRGRLVATFSQYPSAC